MNLDFVMTFLNNLKDKVQYSGNILYYIGAIVLALGTARFANAMIYYYQTGMTKSTISTSLAGKSGRLSIPEKSDASSVVSSNSRLYSALPESSAMAVPEELKDFLLVGTLEGHYTIARAIIKTMGKDSTTKEYAIGEKIGAARLAYIGREYIVVKINGQKSTIKAGEKSNATNLNADSKASSSNTNLRDGQVIRKTLSREEVMRTLKGNPAKIYQGATFGPYIQKGKIQGYKIHKVRPSHVFYKLGARGGDIISKVNGHNLGNTDRMFELWRSLPKADRIKIDIKRKGKRLTYDFTIQN